jgi:hypothetical protein
VKRKPLDKATKYARLKKFLMISAAIPAALLTLFGIAGIFSFFKLTAVANALTIAFAILFQPASGAVLILTIYCIALAFRTPIDPETKSDQLPVVIAAAVANLMPTSLVMVLLEAMTSCPEYGKTVDVCNSNIFDSLYTPIAATIYLAAWIFIAYKKFNKGKPN